MAGIMQVTAGCDMPYLIKFNYFFQHHQSLSKMLTHSLKVPNEDKMRNAFSFRRASLPGTAVTGLAASGKSYSPGNAGIARSEATSTATAARGSETALVLSSSSCI